MSQQINLLRDERPRRAPVDALQIVLGAGLVVLALALLGAHDWWRATQLEARAEHLDQERAAVSERVEELTERLRSARDADDGEQRHQRLRAELEAKRSLVAYLEEGPLAERDGFAGHLRGLARRVVDDLWLARIRFAAGGREIRLHGHALAPEHVPAMIRALGEEPVFDGHAFRRMMIRRDEETPGRLDFELASRPADEAGASGGQR